ncbi:MAG TPA: ABC transporter permease [Armatimonadota bacterium]|nr:ABC transporter permease [Armatimonadota bacterium]
MTAYWAILKVRFIALLQYRTAALAGIFCQIFFGLIMVMAYGAFYRSSHTAQPLEYQQVISYVWLGQIFYALQPWGVDGELATLIRNGNVAYEMLRPLDLFTHWYMRCIALRTAPTLLRAVPMATIALCFLGMRPPASLASAGAFLAALIGAVLLASALTLLMSMSLLWTISGEGVISLVGTAAMFLSGMIVPLPFFPDWAQGTLNLLPFRGIVDAPFRLYLGQLPPEAVVGVLAHQLFWISTLILLGRWLLAHGCRRLVVQGG